MDIFESYNYWIPLNIYSELFDSNEQSWLSPVHVFPVMQL